jgi:glycosyltransferase involved in cell wall biosynthesis
VNISVIIRAKNEEVMIGEVLEKLFSQTYKGAVEIVLVDSGSADRTLDIARSFPVRIVTIPPERFTYGYSLNYGVQNSTGEIICCLSAHCVPLNGQWLAELLRPIREGIADATYGRQVPLKGVNPFEEVSLSKHFPGERTTSGRIPFSNANCAFKRKMWEEVKFNETIPSWEDYLWYLLLKDKYRFRYCPDAAGYHTHPFSLGSTIKRAFNDGRAFRMIREMYGVDIISDAYPSSFSKIMGVWRDVIRHTVFFWKQGYKKHIPLIPLVRFSVLKAYRDGYISLV